MRKKIYISREREAKLGILRVEKKYNGEELKRMREERWDGDVSYRNKFYMQ